MRGCSLALTSPRALAARRGQLTLGVGNDRYVWMIKLWPLLYGGTTPQFALTLADWMHYTWVVMWCHCQVFFDVPSAIRTEAAAVAFALILAWLVVRRRRQARLAANAGRPAWHEVMGIVAAEEATGARPPEVAMGLEDVPQDALPPHPLEDSAPYHLSSGADRGTLGDALCCIGGVGLLLGLCFLLGTYSLHANLSPHARIPQVYATPRPR